MLGADVVLLDLEDSVTPDQKESARSAVVHALLNQDWLACSVAVRINSTDTAWWRDDITDVVRAAGDRLNLLVVPKVSTPEEIDVVAEFLSRAEAELGLDPIGLSVVIENPLGLVNVEAIARGCPERLEAIVFGPGDYAASVGARTTGIGMAIPEYAVLTDSDAGRRELHWNDPWHYPLARIVAAARAYGLRPIDGPFGGIDDPEGFLMSARRAAALGYEGKWVIHPSQIRPANNVFTPSEAEVARAQRIVAAHQAADREGTGAISLDGRMIDAASIRMALAMLAKVAMIERLAVARNVIRDPDSSSP